jgi:dUTP pyrophosphatase
MQLYIKKLHPDAKMPNWAHATDAGLDLCTIVDSTIAPGERVSIGTGIALQIPAGYVGLIWDKSGVSQKGGLKTLGGVIDAGYRGEIFVGLLNIGAEPYHCTQGQKIAQILIQKVEHPEIIEVTELDETARGDGAFGSTGV